MDIQPDELEAVVKRLRRAQGQIGGVIRMIEDQRECEDIVTQLAAVSKAVDKAAFTVIATGIRQCVDTGETTDSEKLERLFLSFA